MGDWSRKAGSCSTEPQTHLALQSDSSSCSPLPSALKGEPDQTSEDAGTEHKDRGQRGKMVWPRSHTKCVAELGFEHRSLKRK